MRRSNVLLIALAGILMLPCGAAQQTTKQTSAGTFPFIGAVTGSNVRLRSGPGEGHAILSLMESGTLLKVHALHDEWYEVEPPGGLALYVCGGEDQKTYVEEEAPGRGVVRVATLLVRPTPETAFPHMAKLHAGDRVVLLDAQKNWYRILAPAGVHAYVHKDYVKVLPDQAAAAALFADAHVKAEKALLAGGALSGKMLAAEAEEAQRREQAARTFERYEEERKKSAGSRDVAGLRAALEAVRDAAPEGSEDRAHAVALLKTLDDWQRLREAFIALEKKRKEIEKESQQRYSEELAALRKEIEARRKEEAKGTGDSRLNGWVRRLEPVRGLIRKGGPRFALIKGNQQECLLFSDRYDLADFTGMLVVLVEHDEPRTETGRDLRVVNVRKLEILEGR